MQDLTSSPSAISPKKQAPERLSELVLEAAKKHGARVALRLRKSGVLVQCTYSEMAEKIEAIGNALVQAGIRPGDRVVLLSDNSQVA